MADWFYIQAQYSFVSCIKSAWAQNEKERNIRRIKGADIDKTTHCNFVQVKELVSYGKRQAWFQSHLQASIGTDFAEDDREITTQVQGCTSCISASTKKDVSVKIRSSCRALVQNWSIE